jgi:hypothetical protein
MKKALIILGFTFILTSCYKSINGKITDNFDQPVENVQIKILNSGYESTSKKNGEFSIDFSAGKFTIDFQKNNYISVQKELEISDQKNYPIGGIKMFRIPDTVGIYFKDKMDFIKIPKSNYNIKKKRFILCGQDML